MYKLGQQLHLLDGSLIQISRTINANTFEFTILQTGKQLIDEILSRTKASNFGPAPAVAPTRECQTLHDRTAAWVASILRENHKERPNADRQ